MNVYIYQGNLFCEDCGEEIREDIDRDGPYISVDPDDETTYDSDEYPKGPYPDGGGEADCPQHCGSGADCINAIELSGRCKIGAWLGNPLTPAGERYIREAHRKRECGGYGTGVAVFWAKYYDNCPD